MHGHLVGYHRHKTADIVLNKKTRTASKRTEQMPKVSVIIPTFNREKFIIKAIDTVVAQSYQNYEIIVVDDGSSDNTRTVLEPYRDRITYLYQDNAGVSSARNAGIRRATGEWISFLDSDDEWRRDYLATQIVHVTRFPEAIAHFTNSVTVFPDGRRSEHFAEIGLLKKFGMMSQCLTFEKPLRVILEHSHWFLQPCIMRRDMLLKTRLFDTDLSIAEDLDVILRLARWGSFSLCKNVLVEIWRREEKIDNLASQQNKQGIYTCQAFGKVYRGFLNLPDLSYRESKAVAKALSQNRRALGNMLLKSGKIVRARALYRRSFSLYPSLRSLIKCLATFLPQKLSVLFVWKGRHIIPGEAVPKKSKCRPGVTIRRGQKNGTER